MAVVKVPKTPKKAFNTHRRPSALLLAQIAHLEWAVLPASQRRPGHLPKQRVITEGQAAERIAQLTRMLAARAGATSRPAAPASPVTLPPLPRPAAAPTRRAV